MTDPIITRGRVRTVIGIEADSLDVTLTGDADCTVLGQQLSAFAADAGFDGARVVVRRHYAPRWGAASVGSLHIFEGDIREANVEGMEVRLQVSSDIARLNMPIPRQVYQASCRHRVFNPGCGLNSAAYEVTGTASSGSTAGAIVTALGNADGYFTLGRIRFTSGALAGQRRTVRVYASGTFTPIVPFSAAPAPGDAFTALPGCDRTRATCAARFSNTDNYGGQKHIPAPELSY